MRFLDLWRRSSDPPDPLAVREDLTRRDPDFRRGRDVKHDLDNLLAGREMWRGYLADERRHERWLRREQVGD